MTYTVPDFNGIAFGNSKDGTSVLFLIPLAAAQFSTTVEQAMQSAREWLLGERKINNVTAFMGFVDSRYLPDSQPGWTGILGRGEDLSILFRWKKNLTVIDALREIEQAEGGIPAWLCAGLYTASTSIDRGLDPQMAASAVYFASASCANYSIPHTPAFIPRKHLEQLVDSKSLPELFNYKAPGLQSGSDYARFFHVVGTRILDERWYRQRRANLDSSKETTLFSRISFFGAGKLCLDKEPKIVIAQFPLRIRIGSGEMIDKEKNLQASSAHGAMEAAFSLFDYMVQAAPSPGVLKAFFPSGNIDVSQYRMVIRLFEEMGKQNHPSALHLANSLIDEADQKASYSPQGLYRVIIPPEIPLYALGVRALNIFFDVSRVWVQVLFPEPCPTLIPWSAKDFRKDPNEHPYTFSLMMAAILRDFRCSAEYSFPEEKHASSPPPLFEPQPATESNRHAVIKGQSIRVLPVAHRGNRIWGYQTERDHLFHRRHLVGAFRRRLPEEQHRREDALTLAAEFGIILPDEHFTIVLPHARGGNPARIQDPSNPPQVRSRGLAATIAYSNYLKENEMEAEISNG